MLIHSETSLADFKAWGGATKILDFLIENDLVEQAEFFITEAYPDGLSDVELNDTLWFENDWIADVLGYGDWEKMESHFEKGGEA